MYDNEKMCIYIYLSNWLILFHNLFYMKNIKHDVTHTWQYPTYELCAANACSILNRADWFFEGNLKNILLGYVLGTSTVIVSLMSSLIGCLSIFWYRSDP